MRHVTDPVRTAVAMPWGGDRNLALRSALELVDGEVGMVNLGDVVQVVVDERHRATVVAARLRVGLGRRWEIQVTRRSDGRRLVTAAKA